VAPGWRSRALNGSTTSTASSAAPHAPTVTTGVASDQPSVVATSTAPDAVAVRAGTGVRAWVLVEDDADQVTVTVRDDGVGVTAGRLAAARAEGRLGVAHTIVGRMRAMGGHASITSTIGQGTEVELRLPKVRAAGQRDARAT
jgi:Histidine kinase-, DNA gyrase B-, and HSP90-like ATPase